MTPWERGETEQGHNFVNSSNYIVHLTRYDFCYEMTNIDLALSSADFRLILLYRW